MALPLIVHPKFKNVEAALRLNDIYMEQANINHRPEDSKDSYTYTFLIATAMDIHSVHVKLKRLSHLKETYLSEVFDKIDSVNSMVEIILNLLRDAGTDLDGFKDEAESMKSMSTEIQQTICLDPTATLSERKMVRSRFVINYVAALVKFEQKLRLLAKLSADFTEN